MLGREDNTHSDVVVGKPQENKPLQDLSVRE
jgi:hypothetical protein